MPHESLVMFAVAALIGAGGLWMIAQIRKPISQQRVYAYRMIGVMALAGAIVLAMSATAMWVWSADVRP